MTADVVDAVAVGKEVAEAKRGAGATGERAEVAAKIVPAEGIADPADGVKSRGEATVESAQPDPPDANGRVVRFDAQPEAAREDADRGVGGAERRAGGDGDGDDGGGDDRGGGEDEEACSSEGERSSSSCDSEGDVDDGGEEGGAALAAGLAEMPKGVLKSLLSSGKLGTKALHAAAAADDVDELDRLLAKDGEYAGSVDDLDPFEYTALHVAAESGSANAVVALVRHGADVESETRMHGSRPIHYSCMNGRAAATAALLAGGCDVDPRTDDLRTPLYQAALRGHADCVKILLAAGADRSVETREGKSAVAVAANDAVRELLERPPRKRARTATD
jgi:hypothetical protein